MSTPLQRIAFFVMFLAVTVGLGVYVTAIALAPGRFATVVARVRLVYAAAVAVIVVTLIEIGGRVLAPLGGGFWRAPLWVVRVSGIALMIITVAVVLIELASRLVAWVFEMKARLGRAAVAHEPADDAAETRVVTRRELMVSAASKATGAAVSAGVLYGGLIERHDLQLTELTVVLPDLAPSLDGLTIVQLTDLHVGIFTGTRELDAVIAKANALRGDVLVLTGDIIDSSPRHIVDGMRALSRLRGRLGVFAALGNHDHYTGAQKVRRGLEAVGIRCLVNDVAHLHNGDVRRGVVTLAGVDDVMAGALSMSPGPDLAATLRRAAPESPVVLLAHNPVFFDEASGRVALQLSGHTHGGQINVGGIAKGVLPYVAGRYERSRTTLYVSRGIGITGPPVRLASPPEVVRITLTGRST